MKKLLLLCLACLLLLSVCLASCGEDTPETDTPDDEEEVIDLTPTPDLLYTETYDLANDRSGYVIMGCLDKSALKTLVIPETVNGKPVVAIADSAFEDCYRLTYVSLPESITYIGTSAFESCIALKTFIVPESVDTIGSSVFAQCKALTRLTYFGTEEQWNEIVKPENWTGTNCPLKEVTFAE